MQTPAWAQERVEETVSQTGGQTDDQTDVQTGMLVEETSSQTDDQDSAEDVDDLTSLLEESVVTTASRGAQRATTAPAAVFTITAEEMRIYGVRTVAEALDLLGIGIQTSRVRDYGGGADFGAQGLMLHDAGRRVLVLVDGQVMNAQDTGSVQLDEGLGVPLEAIDHIEVVLGAGSVMYGTNAILAVVHVFTRRAADDPGVHVTAELGLSPPTNEGQPTTPSQPGDRVGLRYRLGLGFAHAFRFLDADAEVTVRAEWLEEISNSYRVPVFTTLPEGGLQLYPGQSAWGGAAHHSMQVPSFLAALRVGDFRLQVQANRYARSMPLVGTFNDPESMEVRRQVRIDLRHSTLLDPHVELTSRIYYGLSDWSERSVWTSPFWCPPGQIDGCRSDRQSRGIWAGAEQQLAIDWNLDGALVTTVGYDVRGRDATMRPADYLDRITRVLPYATVTPYSHRVSVLGAIFAQQSWRPVEMFTINLGGRLDMDSLFGARVSPRLALALAPVEGTSIRASYSEAFRAPTAFELDESDATFRVRAPGLTAEVARTVEMEWQQRVAWASFSLRGFVSFYENFIDTRPATAEEAQAGFDTGALATTADPLYIVRWDNLNTLRSVGGSLAFTLRPVEGLTLGGSFVVTDTRNNEQPVPLVPLWMGNARVAYAFERAGPTLALAATFSGKRIAFADFEHRDVVYGNEQLDLRATLTSPLAALPGLSLRVTFAYAVNPFMPYLLDATSDESPDSVAVLTPTPSSLFGFMGLQYDIDP
jgi:outer membrane receptor protein involved in Fe transport